MKEYDPTKEPDFCLPNTWDWMKTLVGEPLQFELFKRVITGIKIKQLIHDISQEVYDPPVMLELGAAKGEYSTYFNQELPSSTNICVEIRDSQADYIRGSLPGSIVYSGYCGPRKHLGESTEVSWGEDKGLTTTKINLKDIFVENNLEHVDILHMDIQGSEASILEELANEKLLDKIEYLFISTHGRNTEDCTYTKCIKIFKEFVKNITVKYIFTSINPIDTNNDGLIVVKLIKK
tara:strand:+ start:720 stop:1424 length:705 start_codon:yes stop_codon:yes gene_type:complete